MKKNPPSKSPKYLNWEINQAESIILQAGTTQIVCSYFYSRYVRRKESIQRIIFFCQSKIVTS